MRDCGDERMQLSKERSGSWQKKDEKEITRREEDKKVKT